MLYKQIHRGKACGEEERGRDYCERPQAKECWQLSEAGRGREWNLPRASGGSPALLVPSVLTLASKTVREPTSAVTRHLVRSDLLRPSQGTDTVSRSGGLSASPGESGEGDRTAGRRGGAFFIDADPQRGHHQGASYKRGRHRAPEAPDPLNQKRHVPQTSKQFAYRLKCENPSLDSFSQ